MALLEFEHALITCHNCELIVDAHRWRCTLLIVESLVIAYNTRIDQLTGKVCRVRKIKG